MIDYLGWLFLLTICTGSAGLYVVFYLWTNGTWTPLRRFFAALAISSGFVWVLEVIDPFGLFAVANGWLTRAARVIGARGLMAWAVLATLYALLWRPPRARQMPTAQIILDTNGFITGWNAAAAAVLGYRATEVLNPESPVEMGTLIFPEEAMVEYEGARVPAREAHLRGLMAYLRDGFSPIVDQRLLREVVHRDGARRSVTMDITAHETREGTTFLVVLVPRIRMGG